MTISTTVNRYTYTGNGVTTAFPYSSKFLADGDLKVYQAGTLKTLTTHYTVSGAGASGGGTVTFLAAPANGEAVVIYGDPANTQDIDLVESGAFPVEPAENALDRRTLVAQRDRDLINRSIRIPDSDSTGTSVELPSSASRASKYMAFDASGNVVPTAGTTSSYVVTPFMETVLDDANATAVRATLGVTDATAKGDVLTATGAGAFIRKAVGANGDVLTADSGQSDGLIWVPNPQISYAPNPFFQVDQLANSATSVADDNYGHDHWYVLTQTASIQVSTQTLQENGQTANVRLTQNQAAAQRMGYACIIEAKEAQKLRGQTMTFKPRIRCSSSQAIRCAVVEWTGTADSVTSDIVNDWTSSDYTDGAARFFVDANLNPLGTSSITPSAATWTDATQLPVMVSSSCNNLILFVWTEGTAAQNVTLDIGKVRFVLGNYSIGDVYIPTFEETLRYAMRFYEKSFPYLTAPAQAGGYTGSEVVIQAVGAAVANQSSYRIPFKVNKRNASPTLTLFNPLNANSQAVNSVISTDCTLTASGLSDDSSFYFTYTTAAGSAAGQSNRLHWTAAVRL